MCSFVVNCTTPSNCKLHAAERRLLTYLGAGDGKFRLLLSLVYVSMWRAVLHVRYAWIEKSRSCALAPSQYISTGDTINS